jgi:hypothetical protein
MIRSLLAWNKKIFKVETGWQKKEQKKEDITQAIKKETMNGLLAST